MPESTDNRPAKPGWYWVRASHDDPWHVTWIVEVRGEPHVRDPYLGAIRPIAVADPLWDDVEWSGPIMPDDPIDRRRVDFLESGPVWQVTRWPGQWLIRWLDGSADCKVEYPTLRETIDAAMANIEDRSRADA